MSTEKNTELARENIRSDNSDSKKELCHFCKTLEKIPTCNNAKHKDGCHYEIRKSSIEKQPSESQPDSKSTSQDILCSYCKSLSKILTCKNTKHVDGHYHNNEISSRDEHLKSKKDLCQYCLATFKKSACTNARHVNGFYLVPKELCHYCKTLEKVITCNNSRHIDGYYYNINVVQHVKEVLCPFCKSLDKLMHCTNFKHIHGYPFDYVPPSAISQNRAQQSSYPIRQQSMNESRFQPQDRRYENRNDRSKGRSGDHYNNSINTRSSGAGGFRDINSRGFERDRY